MPTGFRIDPEKCTECLRCLAACSWVKLGEVRPGLSRITVLRRWPQTPEIRVCRFDECPGQPCVASCPVAAIGVRRAAGGGRLVLIDRQACSGCGACLEACPFQAIRLEGADPAEAAGGEGAAHGLEAGRPEPRAFKCDFCAGAPACVPECVTGALVRLAGEGEKP